jgi:hypothetical protein
LGKREEGIEGGGGVAASRLRRDWRRLIRKCAFGQ